ncbi:MULTISPECIES: helix-turn-helix transcriptional regulator [Staphylococcus]|uniref:helix-turn-helix transcriptional regulator n=1 Tax=Staphylococcus TaxID=1279 RepID=UPI0021D00082|nr:helix-turn-helix transcriptional regulator [Staphylococcus arlettae]UXU48948.1 helix-turn-helix transcriptional regulator [Staphylococcus arlettae]
MNKIPYPFLYIIRKEYGHSQKDIAKKLSISAQHYQLKETGKANFTLPEAKILSEVYEMPINDLFSSSIKPSS